MSFLKAWEIYPSDLQIKNREQALSLSRRSSVGMNCQPVIPGGVLSSSSRFRFTGQNQHAMVSNKGQGLYSKWQPVPNFAVSPQGCTPVSSPVFTEIERGSRSCASLPSLTASGSFPTAARYQLRYS